MTFSEYVQLLYRAFLQDKGYLQTLRDKIKSEEFNREQLYNPAFHNWKSINPRDPATYQSRKVRFFPNPINPEDGIYVYEQECQGSKDRLGIIKKCLRRRKDHDRHKES